MRSTMISQSRTPAGILRTLTAILCLAAILMSVTGSSAWAAPRVVRVVGIQDGISDSQADYFRRTRLPNSTTSPRTASS